MLGHKNILKMGNPILRKIAAPFSDEEIKSTETKLLISKMWKVMDEAGGIGLAAEYIMFNPTIDILTEETQGYWEGCLSVPGLKGFVERPSKIRVNYIDQNLELKKLVLDGFLATVFQHEIDHLFGKLYVDRINNKELLLYEEEFFKLDIDQ